MQLIPLEIEGIRSDGPCVIAGPCSAETEQQVLASAEALAAVGVKVYRAGIWKPRTMPGGFEGAGIPGLAWLAKAKKITGMKIATEVANRGHVAAAIEYGVDILWTGARTTANPFAMQEIADAIKECGKEVTVLVKNPVNPDLELWIGGIKRLYNAGIRKIGAVHRGFSTYGYHIYRNDPQWRIPLDLRIRIPQLPIIFDPSHIGGRRDLIQPLSEKAMEMGFDGLIIECHCDPDAAWSDRNQQITPDRLAEILAGITTRSACPESSPLTEYREEIDSLDSQLIEILAQRMEVSRLIGRFKQQNNIPVIQPGRFDSIMTSRLRQAHDAGMSEEFMRAILSAIHEESVRMQCH